MSDTTTTEETSPADEQTHASGEPASPLMKLAGYAAGAIAIVALFLVVQAIGGEDESPAPAAPSPPLSGEAPREGSVAPDFSVPTLEGDTFSLSEHLAADGRPVFVNMWAEWCFPCREEMPAIEAAFQAHPEIHFIGVVVRDREAPARRFVEEFGITYQIGLDTDGAVEQGYQVWVMPSTYLIGSDGRVIERFFGPITEEQLEELIARASTA